MHNAVKAMGFAAVSSLGMRMLSQFVGMWGILETLIKGDALKLAILKQLDELQSSADCRVKFTSIIQDVFFICRTAFSTLKAITRKREKEREYHTAQREVLDERPGLSQERTSKRELP